MSLWARFRFWLRTVVQRSPAESEMDEELHFHLEAYAEALVRDGVPHEKALRRARLEFGGAAQTKEECRDQAGLHNGCRASPRIASRHFQWKYLFMLKRRGLGLKDLNFENGAKF